VPLSFETVSSVITGTSATRSRTEPFNTAFACDTDLSSEFSWSACDLCCVSYGDEEHHQEQQNVPVIQAVAHVGDQTSANSPCQNFIEIGSGSSVNSSDECTPQEMKVDRAAHRRQNLAFKGITHRMKTYFREGMHGRRSPDCRNDPVKSHRAARSALRTCLALGAVQTPSDLPTISAGHYTKASVSRLLHCGRTEAKQEEQDLRAAADRVPLSFETVSSVITGTSATRSRTEPFNTAFACDTDLSSEFSWSACDLCCVSYGDEEHHQEQQNVPVIQGFGNAAESDRLQRHRPFVPLLRVSSLVPDLDFNVQDMKFDRAMCRRTKLSFKCSEYRRKTANESHNLARYSDKRFQKPPQAHRAARVATRTCLALGVVEEASDMPFLVGHGLGHTCVSKLLRRAITLEDASEFDLCEWELPTEALGSPMDCVEDPSLFDLTKAMVVPEPNAEFSLCGDLSSPVCEVCTGELPCSRLLHVSAKLDNMCDLTHCEMDDGAVADVFAFENLPCPVPSTRMSTDNEDDPLTAKLVAENERLHAALSEARRENAKLAIQRTEHVDFAHLLELAKEFGDGFGDEDDSFLDPLCSSNIPHFDMSSADAEVAQLKCELQDSRLEVARLRAQLASHGIGRTAEF